MLIVIGKKLSSNFRAKVPIKINAAEDLLSK